MAIREEQVAAAIRFLGNEKVVSRPASEKEGFLARKGLTHEEIAEAFRRYERGETGASPGAPSAAPSAPPPTGPAPPAGYAAPGYQPGGYPPPQPWSQPVPPYAPEHYQAAPAPPWAAPMPPPPSASASGPWWAWLLGGLGAGLVGTAVASQFFGRPEAPELQYFQQPPQQFAPERQAATGAPPVLALGQAPAEAADTGGEPEHKAGERPVDQASYEGLVALLRQQCEEARENSALFAKALQSSQEQQQKLFNEMQKALQAVTQQQRPAKPPPMELSAATIQSLATLIRPSTTGEPGGSSPAGSGAPQDLAAGLGFSNPLRESFDAINLNLQRMVREGTGKEQVAKSLSQLAMILGNLLNNPSEKTCKVNTTSSRFRDLLGSGGAAAELLKVAGFQYQEPNFTFSHESVGTDAAQRVLDLLQETQRSLDRMWNARDSLPPPPATGSSGTGATAEGAEQASLPTPPAVPIAPAAAPGPPVAVDAATPPVSNDPQASAAALPWATETARPPPPWVAAAKRNGGASSTAPRPAEADAGEEPSEALTSAVPRPGTPGSAVVAHPAESLELPGPPIAHPAEAEVLPLLQPGQGLEQRQAPPPMPTQAVAHPAESVAVEEPQSGG